jgi:hypothetical protein
MVHRKVCLESAHFVDRIHLESGTLTRIQSAVIFGSIGSGLLACALGAFIFDLGRAVSAW